MGQYFGILLHPDNAGEIAIYEDISLASARSAIAAATFVEGEPRYIVFDESGEHSWEFLDQAALDEKFRYNPKLIQIEVVRLILK